MEVTLAGRPGALQMTRSESSGMLWVTVFVIETTFAGARLDHPWAKRTATPASGMP